MHAKVKNGGSAAARVTVVVLLFFLCMQSSCSQIQSSTAANAEKYKWETQDSLSKDETGLAYRIDTFFNHKVKHSALNGSVLVAEHGHVIYQNSFGFSDYGKKRMLNDSSTFELASVSKPFTATAILILVEEGKMKLDDKVSKYIPRFPYDSITIQMLLSHRSGLSNYIYLFDTMKMAADSFITNQDVVNYFIENVPPLQWTPGRHFQYCNSNYALLASIITIVSGDSYADFLQKNIFSVAHMHHTYVRDVFSNEVYANQTKDYRGARWEKVSNVPYDGVDGDKGIYSTPWDLYLFDQALNQGLILKKKTLDEAYKGYSYEKAGIKNYGLGWRLKEFTNGEKLVYHNGWWRGYTSLFARRPDRDACIIVLSNKYNRSTYDMKNLFEMLHMTDGKSEVAEDASSE